MSLYFTIDHEWIDAESPQAATVGITRHARDALDDIFFVNLPSVGSRLARGGIAAVVESLKTATDVGMPVSGEIVEVNDVLRADPSLAGSDPAGAGWFFKVRIDDPNELDGLMRTGAYENLLRTLRRPAP